PVAGRLKPVAAEPALEAQHPQSRSVTLLGMGPVTHQSFDKDGDMVAETACPGDQIFRGHPAMALVRLGHVFFDGGMTAACASAGVNGNAVMIVEYLDHPVGQADIDPSADQAVRHRIE